MKACYGTKQKQTHVTKTRILYQIYIFTSKSIETKYISLIIISLTEALTK
jgi:hypothetical protein